MRVYSLVLLDVDGTLLDSRDQVSFNTKKLLGRLQRRGIPVALCSSRSPAGVEYAARQAGVRGPSVCYGGGLVLDENQSILEDAGIAPDEALRFRAFAHREFPDVAVTSFLYGVWLVDSVRDPFVQKFMDRFDCEALEGPLEAAVRNARHVHKFLCMGQPMALKRLAAQAAPLFPALNLVLSGLTYLEVLDGRVSKEAAMDTVARYCGARREDTVAVGDYYVDMELLRLAGLGIAMGNAPEAVQQAADRVTASNDDEGVYIALKNLRFRAPAPVD